MLSILFIYMKMTKTQKEKLQTLSILPCENAYEIIIEGLSAQTCLVKKACFSKNCTKLIPIP